MARKLWLAALMVLAFGPMAAQAGVQDSVFEGNVYRVFRPGSENEANWFVSFRVEADFGDDFDLFREEFDGDERFGDYEENDSGLFSTWSVDYAFDDDYEAFGFSLFGFITTYNINEINGDNDFFGILFRTGESDLINVRPPAAD